MRIIKLCKSGWIEGQGLQYVCPSFQIVDLDKKYRLKDSFESEVVKQGNLQDWQDNVAKYCYGNHLLVFSLCVALSGVILKFVPGINSTIFNFVGKSSIGKTTALRVAASVWGNKRFIQQWRATSNALEAIAESHNDNLLILDELSQSSGKDISETFYMLGNSRGKNRMKSDSTLRKAKSWSLMILSSGEVGIADKIEEGGGKVKAGQLVRAIDIDANVGGYGIFNCLHSMPSGSDLSNLLNQNTGKYYGIVAEEFVRQLTRDITECDLTDAIQNEFGNAKQHIYSEFNLKEAHGQVQRVANVFALVEVTGVLAVNFGIFQTTQEQIQESIDFVFERWLSERGRGAVEDIDIVEKLQDWILQNEARFRDWNFPDLKVLNALGYKKIRQNEDKIYYVLPEAFRKEFCRKELGQSPKSVRKFLAEKSILKVDLNDQDERVSMPYRNRKRMTTLVFRID